MWLLSCEGDLFNGKRLWLRPGSTHLLGRTSGKTANGERVQYIDHKSVSRKHLVLQVNEIKPGESTQLLLKSEVHAIDGSKTGTTIDGEKLNNGEKVLTGDTHVIKLGSYAPAFKLQWQPVVLSLTTLPKAAKARNEALASFKEKLEHAGVKIATEYVINQTTHLIAKKRNTAAGLQALVQGRWLLTDGFSNALADACERKDDESNGEANISLLEQDFDAFWPKEEDYIVPAGGEPVVRPNEMLRPNPERAEVFQSMTFVFLSQNQHDQLMPVVTSGSGKTTLHPFELGESTTQDVIEFVQNVAGQKRSRSNAVNKIAAQNKIVVVRSVVKEEGREQDIMRDIEIALNRRSMEQNEFLDVILMNDASSLIRSLRDASPRSDSEDVDDTTIVESPAAKDAFSKREPAGLTQESSATARRRNRLIVTGSRFKGFDDFDPSQVIEPESHSPKPSSPDRETSHAPSAQGTDSDTHGRSSRKRRALHDPVEAERRMLDRVAPSTAGPKRLRRDKPSSPSPAHASTRTHGMVKEAQETTDILKMDIQSAIKERRAQEEERRRLDEETLHHALEVNPAEVRNRVQVDTFDLPSRSRRARDRDREPDAVTGDTDGWNPTWTGRPNFKKFRRLNAAGHEDDPRAGTTPPARRQPKRLVALEEVPRKGLGTEEEYFLQSSGDRSRSQSQAQAQASIRAGAPAPTAPRSKGKSRTFPSAGDDDEAGDARRVEDDEGEEEEEEEDSHADHLAFRRRIERSRAEDAETEELGMLVPDGRNGRTASMTTATRSDRAMPGSSSSAARVLQTQRQRQTLVADSQGKAAGKRPAVEVLSGGTTKKAKPGRAAAVASSFSTATRSARFEVSDDDDDALRFRRKKR